MAAKLKSDDRVVVIAGKDKGATGTIEAILPKQGKAVVDGVNMAIRHSKQSEREDGGRIPKYMPIDLSNLALIDPSDGRPTRVGFRLEEGKKVRYSKRTGETIDD